LREIRGRTSGGKGAFREKARYTQGGKIVRCMVSDEGTPIWGERTRKGEKVRVRTGSAKGGGKETTAEKEKPRGGGGGTERGTVTNERKFWRLQRWGLGRLPGKKARGAQRFA